MKQPPRLASVLLGRLASADAAFVGDLDEAYWRGHAAAWYWRQTIAFLLLSPFRQCSREPLRSIRALAIGWAVFLMLFELFDVLIAWRLSSVGYRTGEWMPFWIVSFLASYAGFAVSAWVVARLHPRTSGPVLILHVGSVLLAMVVGATVVQLRFPEGTPIPHLLFPLVSVALPYQWRSGLLLVPLAMLIAGMIGSRTSQRLVSR